MTRRFEATEAVRKGSPLLLSIFSPSGGGKTMSALELATGITSVYGREIVMIDSENFRGLHYAPPDFDYKFKHVPFSAPFSPIDYMDVLQYALKMNPGVIIVDQFSFEHDGTGGILEWHEAELDRMAGDDYKKREKMTFTAWIKPKAAHKKLLNMLVESSTDTAFIFLFRAAEKTQIIKGDDGKTKPVDAGFMPLGSRDFVFESLCSFFLPPRSDGFPLFDSDMAGEKLMMKIPKQFRDFLKPGVQLNREVGRRLAEWAKGGAKAAPQPAREIPLTERVSEIQIQSLHDLQAALDGMSLPAAKKAASRMGEIIESAQSMTHAEISEIIRKADQALKKYQNEAA